MEIVGQFAYWVLRSGRIVAHERKKNLVVDAARKIVAGLITSDENYSSPIKALAIGSGTESPVRTQTKLVNEVFRRALPVYGTNSLGSANYVDTTNTNRYKAVFRETLQPHLPGGSYGGTLKDGVNTSGDITISEAGLFGNLIELDDPTTETITVSNATTGGSIADGDYEVKFAWTNLAGETALSTNSDSVNITSGTGTNKITVTIADPILITATAVKIYVSKDSGDFLLQKTQAISVYTSDIVVQLTEYSESGAVAGDVNTTPIPSAIDGGTMFNRILIGPTTLHPNDQIQVESILEF